MSITEFLLARIAEDEEATDAAQADCPAPWSTEDEQFGGGLVLNDADGCSMLEAAYADSESYARTTAATHIVRHDPARVLAECAAKRTIIEEVGKWGHEYNDDDMWYSCGMATDSWADNPDEPGSGCSDESKRGRCTCGLEQRQLRILGPLAVIYSDHPDYVRAWEQ